MKNLTILGVCCLALTLGACGDDDEDNTPAGFPQPAGTVAVNFRVDASTNQLYADRDLEWKGSFTWTEATRMLSGRDDTWGGGVGPYPPLFDDGPWDRGGHEPKGETAGDGIFGITVFVTPPATGSVAYNFGLHDTVYQEEFGNGWVFPYPSPGEFVVNAGATGEIDADADYPVEMRGGNIDLRLTVDMSAVTPPTTGSWSEPATVKASWWGWSEIAMSDDGTTQGDETADDGIWTFTMSEHMGSAGKQYSHTGLLPSGQLVQFVFVFNGDEYKVGGAPPAAGVAAQVKVGTGAWTTTAVSNQAAGDQNTIITTP